MKNLLIFIKLFIFIIFILFSNSLFAKKAAIVIDYDSKEVLFEVNADTLNFPASLTKIMTLYITFDYLHKNKLSWKTSSKSFAHSSFSISEQALFKRRVFYNCRGCRNGIDY